ncbi:oligosaccharide flippase family protein [Jeongeupia naejangsanensis]|uniref:Flippase n=1 Tax=Jeongeupia naejangsanensis TaxID=613195 RepID=A0ABS2BQK4_9NEIS|nr:oligosaccharide flippase family protein [Jeongeupia naejangsanensis]MBM3117231.1 flippase [Jeongeupia naejangsanensis]
MALDARLKGNIFALYLVQGLNYLVSLVTFPFLARTLGADGFGVQSYAFAVVQYGVLLTDFGFNLSATREVAIARGDTAAIARVFWRTNVAKAMLMCVSCVSLAVAIGTVPEWREHAPVFWLSLLYVVSSVFFPIWYFQGLELMRAASLLTVAGRVVVLGALLLMVRGPDDVAIAVVLQALPAFVAGAYWWCTGHGAPRPSWVAPTRADIGASLKAGWPLFLSALSTNLYTTSTAVLLGWFASPAQVGYFAAANKLTYTVQGLIGPLVQATYPRIAQLASHDKPAAVALIGKAFRMQGAAGLGLTLVLMLGAPWIVPLLLGKGMLGSVETLIWLAPVVLLGALSYVYGLQSLLPFGDERYYSKVLVVAGVVNVGLLLLLLPGRGAVAAAQIVVAVEVFILMAFWWRARVHLKKAA